MECSFLTEGWGGRVRGFFLKKIHSPPKHWNKITKPLIFGEKICGPLKYGEQLSSEDTFGIFHRNIENGKMISWPQRSSDPHPSYQTNTPFLMLSCLTALFTRQRQVCDTGQWGKWNKGRLMTPADGNSRLANRKISEILKTIKEITIN